MTCRCARDRSAFLARFDVPRERARVRIPRESGSDVNFNGLHVATSTPGDLLKSNLMPHKPRGSRFARAELSDEFTTSETGDSGASLRYGIPIISSRGWSRAQAKKRDRNQAAPLAPLSCGRLYIRGPEITPSAGRRLPSSLPPSPPPSRLPPITVRIASWVCLPCDWRSRVSLSYIPLSFVEYIVRLRTAHVRVYTFRPPHAAAETALRHQRRVVFPSLNNETNKPPSGKKSRL